MYTQYLWPISPIRPISPMQCFYGPQSEMMMVSIERDDLFVTYPAELNRCERRELLSFCTILLMALTI